MADIKNTPAASQPPPKVTYINPRRTAPENSVTLRHHRIAREASSRNSPLAVHQVSITSSRRRNSTEESNETGVSDPKRWFDRSNEHPVAAALDSSMDIDPPFFQRETDSSNEDVRRLIPTQSPAYKLVQSRNHGSLRPGQTQSSSADDFRSVIDDLTIENKRLKEELKKYKQMGPDSLRREKLFEVKVHGLPSRKKRELEAALRDFTTSLDGSSTGVSGTRRKDKSKGAKHFGSSMSKHASSSSGSQSRPVPTDSAYASMSIGAGSTNRSLPGKGAHQGSDQAVEHYLQDVPEGLWPKSNVLAEREKKKLVVRRLEQIFTGKGLGQSKDGQPLFPAAPLATNDEDDVEMAIPQDQISPLTETNREAQIHPQFQRNQGRSRGNGSLSNSRGDRTEQRDAGNDTGSASGRKSSDSSPPEVLTQESEQRPTRPRDLDPDRIQVPSENMDYIRHLGLVAPESRKQYSSKDVSPDTEGWVYLNLLCNLAQLHIYNVTPDFIRSAVSEKSKQFQLSPDGRKIRWRGGAEGTKFSSDSSGSNSQRENVSEDTDESNDGDARKKQKIEGSGNGAITSEPSKFVAQISNSSGSFHYKPLFVHHQSSSSEEQLSVADESGSSCDPPEESNLGIKSKWNHSGVSRVSQRKRRRDGAIIYYTGAPFCTDLSGDFGELSPDTTLAPWKETAPAMRGPGISRTMSGSSIPFKPLASYVPHHAMMDIDSAPPGLSADDSDDSDDIDARFPWSNSTQSAPRVAEFEASGLGGITPDDHFVVTVSTLRPKSAVMDGPGPLKLVQRASQDTAESKDVTEESIVGQLATMSTDSPLPSQSAAKRGSHQSVVDIEYVSGKVRRLPPAPLPPATFFFGSSDSTSSSGDSEEYQSDEDDAIRQRQLFRPGQALSESNDELSSNDEEDEHLDDAAGPNDSGSASPDNMGRRAAVVPALSIRRQRGRRASDLSKLTTPSSVATAGGAGSAYMSTEEE